MKKIQYTINDITLKTGISKETLRIWERRYEFPCPDRNTQGDRVYNEEQLNKLSLIKRLLDHNFKPSKILHLDVSCLQNFLQELSNTPTSQDLNEEDLSFLNIIKSNDPEQTSNYLESKLITMSLKNFVLQFIPQLNRTIGNAWELGMISVYQEHMFSESLRETLFKTMLKLSAPDPKKEKFLLTTLQGEYHQFGIILLQTLLRLEGYTCIFLGPDLPASEISLAIKQYKPDICAISISSSYLPKQAQLELKDILKLNPKQTFWIGGKGIENLKIKHENLFFHLKLEDIYKSLNSLDS